MLSRGRRADIRVSALLFAQRPPAISKPLFRGPSFPARLGSRSLSAGIWAPRLSQLGLAPPASLLQKGLSLPPGGLLLSLQPQLSFERKGSRPGREWSLSSEHWVFLSGAVPSFSSRPLRRENPGPGAPTPTPGWISLLDSHLLLRPLLRKKPESLWF